MFTIREKFIASIVGITLVVVAFATSRAIAQKDGLLKIYFLDIGQGDAIFIEAPNGNQMLIDGGPDGKVIHELSEVMPFYDRSIDMVMVSHPHSDHIAGLSDVLDRYDVSYVIQAQEEYDSSEFRSWDHIVSQEGAQEIDAIAGTRITLAPGVTITVVHPLKSVAGTSTKTPHDDVVVALLEYRDVRILFTGDMESEIERSLVGRGIDVRADVLKVGHHGSSTSTGVEFLKTVHPQVAIMQVGASNRYHHPAPTVLERLENSGIPYYRNDTHGRVKLVSDGTSFTIEPRVQ